MLLGSVRPGDTLVVVTRIDRLARSMIHGSADQHRHGGGQSVPRYNADRRGYDGPDLIEFRMSACPASSWPRCILNNNLANNRLVKLRSLCQRYHMLHDRPFPREPAGMDPSEDPCSATPQV